MTHLIKPLNSLYCTVLLNLLLQQTDFASSFRITPLQIPYSDSESAKREGGAATDRCPGTLCVPEKVIGKCKKVFESEDQCCPFWVCEDNGTEKGDAKDNGNISDFTVSGDGNNIIALVNPVKTQPSTESKIESNFSPVNNGDNIDKDSAQLSSTMSSNFPANNEDTNLKTPMELERAEAQPLEDILGQLMGRGPIIDSTQPSMKESGSNSDQHSATLKPTQSQSDLENKAAKDTPENIAALFPSSAFTTSNIDLERAVTQSQSAPVQTSSTSVSPTEHFDPKFPREEGIEKKTPEDAKETATNIFSGVGTTGEIEDFPINFDAENKPAFEEIKDSEELPIPAESDFGNNDKDSEPPFELPAEAPVSYSYEDFKNSHSEEKADNSSDSSTTTTTTTSPTDLVKRYKRLIRNWLKKNTRKNSLVTNDDDSLDLDSNKREEERSESEDIDPEGSISPSEELPDYYEDPDENGGHRKK